MTEIAYEVKEIAGKGRGLVATRDIAVGECILEEEALLQCQQSVLAVPATIASYVVLWHFTESWLHWMVLGIVAFVVCFKLAPLCWVHTMGSEKKRKYFTLSGAAGFSDFYLTSLAIFRVNVLQGTDGAVCRLAGLINHSCAPNGSHIWHADKRREFVYAQKPIKSGEEITIGYIDLFEEYAERRKRLSKYYGFDCTCPTCSMPGPLRDVSDGNRTNAAFLSDMILVKAQRGGSEAEEALEYVNQVLGFIDAEFGTESVHKTGVCWDAHDITKQMGDEKLAKEWGEKACRHGCLTKGPTHPDVCMMKATLKDPAK
mmetsp:Transcript_63496/g.117040  ORF Transcript_63496/g.117040 Transcript_63496/m.117040 type:complete len:315 (+) Transcript_63496:68-1012(+)